MRTIKIICSRILWKVIGKSRKLTDLTIDILGYENYGKLIIYKNMDI